MLCWNHPVGQGWTQDNKNTFWPQDSSKDGLSGGPFHHFQLGHGCWNSRLRHPSDWEGGPGYKFLKWKPS